MVGAPLVEARGLSKRFGDLAALADVDLCVEPGTVHALLGPNGAGKTTLLSILFGLTRADSGSLRFFGREAGRPRPGRLDGVAGFVEAPSFYPYLTGRRNLTTLAALDGGDAPSLVDEVLEQVGLASAAGTRVGGWSLGMRQRLGVAAALLRRPLLLVLDEPTNGLDPAAAADLRRLIRDRAATDGGAVLISSHDMDEMEHTCDTLTVLRAGRVVFDGSLPALRHRAPDPAHRLHTSDDGRATTIAHASAGVTVVESDDPGGLLLRADTAAVDRLVLDLAAAGVAVRRLEETTSSLESLFFDLTSGPAGSPAVAGA